MDVETKRKEFMDWPEYIKHPELFSDKVLAKASVKMIKAIRTNS